MKAIRFPGLACVALAMFALPAAAQASDGLTPAVEDTCDKLVDKTPGLYGLCVAMCEAQDCNAKINRAGEVTYDSSCSPSSDQLLANYMKLADPSKGDPPVPPCVEFACACWTEAQLDDIGGYRNGNNVPTDSCLLGDSYAGLFGTGPDGHSEEKVYVSDDAVNGMQCQRVDSNPPTDINVYDLLDGEFDACLESVRAECSARHVQ